MKTAIFRLGRPKLRNCDRFCSSACTVSAMEQLLAPGYTLNSLYVDRYSHVFNTVSVVAGKDVSIHCGTQISSSRRSGTVIRVPQSLTVPAVDSSKDCS